MPRVGRLDGWFLVRPVAVLALVPVLAGSNCSYDEREVPVVCPETVFVGETFTAEAGPLPPIREVTHSTWGLEGDTEALVCADDGCAAALASATTEWEAVAPGLVTLSYYVGGQGGSCGDAYVTLSGTCTVTIQAAEGS